MTGRATSLGDFARRKIQRLEETQTRRVLHERTIGDHQTAHAQGHTLIAFCTNDYLGLAQHPALKSAAAQAARDFGSGAGASRLVSGNHPLYTRLERQLAALKGTEAALVFGSGYLANLGVIPALMEATDLILADELSHACLISGARLSGAALRLFRHNDMDDLRQLLATHRHASRHCLIISEGVFSMDGDLAPLPDMIHLAHAFDAWSLIDDAHGTGVLAQGRGSAAHWQTKPDIQVATLSKALGTYGGFVASDQSVIDMLASRARSLVFATGLPPSCVAAASAALDMIAAEPDLCDRPLEKARLFCAAIGRPPPSSAIVPLIVGTSGRAMDAAARLAEAGFLIPAIRPPTVPEGTARLRITFAANHRDEDILKLAETIRTLHREPRRT